ncbi:MAG: murein biosynthesis integral membrane protein MurJ [Cyanobacteria bacterium KgW148]|nr:murein biosynthesis integral membrane protein MurJ [Cyanobacteria bacterium KgW148]
MKNRSLLGIAGIVAVATLLSKVMGLVRQVTIAWAFGVGAAVDAYNYAYVIPGFLLILLGGINGPFHSAIVSVISRRPKSEVPVIIETVNTIVGLCLIALTVLLVWFAEPITSLWQGLTVSDVGLITKAIAVEQLQIMAPMALLAGLIGIGFGALNASDQYWLPSISPLFSSVAVVVAVGIFALGDRSDPWQGGRVLAWGTLVGALLQWLVQIPAQIRSGLGSPRLRWQVRHPGVQEILSILVPATLSSGLLYINVNVDLFFAAYIPQAAAALGYAQLLVQTPLGLVSNMLLVPLMPTLSRLTDPAHLPELKERIRQGLIVTALTMLPLSALIIALADPIVTLVYQRGEFTAEASHFVASILIGYGVGMFVYLGRDVLVRVFYALGDGDTPFRLSLLGVGLNVLFDWLWVGQFGAAGLAVATATVNLISLLLLLIFLSQRLDGLPLANWSLPIIQISLISAIGGGVSWLLGHFLPPQPSFYGQCINLSLAGAAGMITIGLLLIPLKLAEVELITAKIKAKLKL